MQKKISLVTKARKQPTTIVRKSRKISTEKSGSPKPSSRESRTPIKRTKKMKNYKSRIKMTNKEKRTPKQRRKVKSASTPISSESVSSDCCELKPTSATEK